MTNKLGYLILSILLIISFQNFGQKKLNAYLQTKQLYAPTIGTIVEIHTQFIATSLSYKSTENGLQASVYYHLTITKGTQEIKDIAYVVNSPLAADSIIEDFYDIQIIDLPAGSYNCVLELGDIIAKTDLIKTSFPLNVTEPKDKTFLSDIIIASSAVKSKSQTVFTKGEYEIIPQIGTFYTPDMSTLPAFIEIYNLNNNHKAVELVYSIENAITLKTEPNTLHSKTYKGNEITQFITPIDISKLGTGKYNLQFQLKDDEGNILDSKIYTFDRQNDLEINLDPKNIILDPAFQASVPKDSLKFYLGSLLPICPPAQQKFLLKELKNKENTEEDIRKLFQAFWIETSPTSPYEGWLKYKLQVQKVEENYRTGNLAGYETDRGRVYLQYGAPSRTFDREMSSSELPWEIWEYNKIGNFSNRKFLFYNPDLVNNHMVLLHSDMLGELKNPRWEHELSKRNTVGGSVDDRNEYNTGSYGNNARQFMYR